VPRQAFKEAAQFFVDTVAQVPSDLWDSPALGVWTVRDLVGHTNRILVHNEIYAAEPATRRDIHDGADYYLTVMNNVTHEEIAQRGRESGQALGQDPLSTVKATAQRAAAVLDRLSDDLLLSSLAGGIRLIDFLPTRVLELVVHTLDIAGAAGIKVDPPKQAMKVTLQLITDIAVRSGKGAELVMSATGRRPLPRGFSVLQ
jgi:uncharacterized protein (TIGR03083 family)